MSGSSRKADMPSDYSELVNYEFHLKLASSRALRSLFPLWPFARSVLPEEYF